MEQEFNPQNSKYKEPSNVRHAIKMSLLENYLSYKDTDFGEDVKKNMFRYNLSSDSADKYSEELVDLADSVGMNTIENLAQQMITECSDVLIRLGVTPSPYAKSKTWAIWDISKQFYYLNHPNQADSRYLVADPIHSIEKQKEIVDRHIGWEVYDAYNGKKERGFLKIIEGGPRNSDIMNLLNKNPKSNGTLSSADLALLGSLLRKTV